MGTDAAVIYVTKPSTPPAADTADQIPPHASWCYATMGDSQCFAHPQNVAPDRLINVDPQNLYPVDLAAYHQALMVKPPTPPAKGEPMALDPISPAPVEKDMLRDEINSDTHNSNAQVP